MSGCGGGQGGIGEKEMERREGDDISLGRERGFKENVEGRAGSIIFRSAGAGGSSKKSFLKHRLVNCEHGVFNPHLGTSREMGQPLKGGKHEGS